MTDIHLISWESDLFADRREYDCPVCGEAVSTWGFRESDRCLREHNDKSGNRCSGSHMSVKGMMPKGMLDRLFATEERLLNNLDQCAVDDAKRALEAAAEAARKDEGQET